MLSMNSCLEALQEVQGEAYCLQYLPLAGAHSFIATEYDGKLLGSPASREDIMSVRWHAGIYSPYQSNDIA